MLWTEARERSWRDESASWTKLTSDSVDCPKKEKSHRQEPPPCLLCLAARFPSAGHWLKKKNYLLIRIFIRFDSFQGNFSQNNSRPAPQHATGGGWLCNGRNLIEAISMFFFFTLSDVCLCLGLGPPFLSEFQIVTHTPVCHQRSTILKWEA